MQTYRKIPRFITEDTALEHRGMSAKHLHDRSPPPVKAGPSRGIAGRKRRWGTRSLYPEEVLRPGTEVGRGGSRVPTAL